MITINAHEKAEWARLAQWAKERGMTRLQQRFSDASTLPVNFGMTTAGFDALQEIYRMWLIGGLKADPIPCQQCHHVDCERTQCKLTCEHMNIDEHFGTCDDCGTAFTQDYGKLTDPESIADAIKRADSHIKQITPNVIESGE